MTNYFYINDGDWMSRGDPSDGKGLRGSQRVSRVQDKVFRSEGAEAELSADKQVADPGRRPLLPPSRPGL